LLTHGVAGAADPTKKECLAASSDWVQARKEHRLHDALDLLLVCASTACPADVREECARHIPDLNAAAPSVVFAATDAAGNDVAAVKVSIDGRPLADKLDGSALPVDPGEHSFRFESEGRPPLDKVFVIREGEKGRHERITLGSGAPAAAASTPQGSAPPAAVAETPAPVTGTSGGGTRKMLGFVAGGLGIVGLAVGVVEWAIAGSKWSSAKTDCGAGCGPSSPARQEKSDAETAATVSTVAFVAGGVLAAGGLALVLTAPSGPSSTAGQVTVQPTAVAGGGALLVRGGF
jgi:hypothetical protein